MNNNKLGENQEQACGTFNSNDKETNKHKNNPKISSKGKACKGDQRKINVYKYINNKWLYLNIELLRIK